MSTNVFNITETSDMLDTIPINDLGGMANDQLKHILGPHFPCLNGARVVGISRRTIEIMFPMDRAQKNIFIESETGGVLKIWKYCYGESCKSIRNRLGII